jgi:hypothetical protein
MSQGWVIPRLKPEVEAAWTMRLVAAMGALHCEGFNGPCDRPGRRHLQSTNYPVDRDNWRYLCEICQGESNDHWAIEWKSYYAGML